MSDKMVVGSITFSNIANPNTWNIGEPKALVFSCPSEAKRGEELFKAAQDAAFKAGREQGMREAAEVAKRGDITGWAMDGEIHNLTQRAERAEAALAEAERKCERLRFHAEAMARDLDDWSIYAGCPSNVAKAYRDEFKEES